MMIPSANIESFVGVLRQRAVLRPLDIAYRFLDDSGGEQASITYAELDQYARRVAVWLQQAGARGDRVLLLYPPSLDFIGGFLGCLYAGAVAVPVYPPRRNQHGARIRTIAEDCGARFALASWMNDSNFSAVLKAAPDLQKLQWNRGAPEELPSASDWVECAPKPESLAMLQYTSGSTGDPKGVMLTHASLINNSGMLAEVFEYTPESACVSWLPMYHDMGLIGGILQPLYGGFTSVLMAPASFMRAPIRWLQAVSDYSAVISGGPNFAYDICVNRISESQKEALDLSSWRVAFCGAEVVRKTTLDAFASHFADCGFRRTAFFPCYGLAEATLIVSGGPRERGAVAANLDAAALDHGLISEAQESGRSARSVVSCGPPAPGNHIAIVRPDSLSLCSPDEVGEILVSGPSVAQGYWNLTTETELTFRARHSGSDRTFLRTGDLGFIRNNEIFIVGRIKDLIIVRGRNLYPDDIEATVFRCHESFRPGCGAAFSLETEMGEELVVVQEVEGSTRHDLASLIAHIREMIVEGFDLVPYTIELVRPGSIPRTSSGKVRRGACRSALKRGELTILARWNRPVISDQDLVSIIPTEPESLADWIRSWLAARLDVHESEIDLGGSLVRYGLDSVSSIDLAHLLEVNLAVEVSLAELMGDTTIHALAERIAKRKMRAPEPRRSVAARDIEQDFPLSAGQASLWFLHEIVPADPSYIIARAARIRGELDFDALSSAFQKIVDRHPALRTSVIAGDRNPTQRIEESVQVSLDHVDASELGDGDFERRLRAEAHRLFDFQRPPLIRAMVFVRSTSERVLLVAVPHIAADFWSMTILLRELDHLYSENIGKTRREPLPISLEYREFVRRQREMLEGAEGDSHRRYWHGALDGANGNLNLHTDHVRNTAISHPSAVERIYLPSDLSLRLREFSARNGISIYHLLIGALQLLLHRTSGQDDLLVASPAACRDVAGFAGTIGNFVNPIILRSRWNAQITTLGHVRETRDMTLAALRHQEYPFASLVEWFQPQRDLGRNPLFQVMFSFQKLSPSNPGLDLLALEEQGAGVSLRSGLRMEVVPITGRTTQLELTVSATESKEGVWAAFEYAADLFESSTIRRMAEQYQRLLADAVAHPDRRVSELSMHSPGEEAQLLALSQRYDTRPGWQGSFIRQTLLQVEGRGDAIAAQCGDLQLSYCELNARANALALRLASLGVGPETRVAVLLERSVEMLVALLATLKAGGAYLPLDPLQPPRRLESILEDAGAAVLIGAREFAPTLESVVVGARPWIDQEEVIGARSESAPAVSIEAENLAYVIYTSGSTGRPKGVEVRHGGLSNFLESMRSRPGLGQEDRLLAVTTISFDIAGLELFLPLTVGARVVVASREESSDGGRLWERMREEGVTAQQATPATWRLLVDAGWRAEGRMKALCGGEALAPQLAVELRGRGAELWNLYGPTETTIWSSLQRVEDEVRLGEPVWNTGLYVLEGEGQLAALGVAGELCIGGEGLARGYSGRPDLTAERFAPDPYGKAGARLYRTGDVARRRTDGSLEYLGRLDHQVKIRGYRIELGEIEAALCGHPDVREAVVVACEENGSDKRLVAYVASGEKRPRASELRERLRERLPEYMTPSAFVLVDELPRTPNGKLDRRALPEPEAWGVEQERGYEAPRTAIEEVVAAIWSGVIGVERVGVQDNFFDLGGHSLLATQVISRLRGALGVDLELRAMFETVSLKELAERVERKLRSGKGSGAPALRKVERDGALPLSFAQERLWFLDRLEPGSAVYNMPAAVRLRGRLEVEALENALTEIVRRHEALRTTFSSEGGSPRQRIWEAGRWSAPRIDLSGVEESCRERMALKLAGEEACRGFDLTRGPLLRTVLLKLGEEDHVAALNMHHIVSDGWSMGVLIREISELYGSYREKRSSRLPELEAQYADYAAWQREWLKGEELEEQLGYWREKLSGASWSQSLPTDRPRGRGVGSRGAVYGFSVGSETASRVRELTRKEGVTLFMALLGVFKALLYRYTGEEDVVVGTPVAGRTRQELEGLIGCFVNTVVLRTEVDGRGSYRELLRRVRETAIWGMTRQELPFEKLVEEMRPERSLSRTPLFEVMFAIANEWDAVMNLPGLHHDFIFLRDRHVPFDLAISVQQPPSGLGFLVEYNIDLFDSSTIERLARRFQELLNGAVSNADCAISSLPMLTPEERGQLISEWNNTSREYMRDDTIVDLIERQVRRNPYATAVESGEASWSYAELNARANRLARCIRARGVRPETLVAVCLERSWRMIVAILAVWKAGAAYVPIDPDYPLERIRHMTQDASAAMLITEEHLSEAVRGVQAPILCVDRDSAEIMGYDDRDLPPTAMPEGLAYVIYTSGSTGEPKGAMIPHGAVVAYVGAFLRASGLGSDDRVLQFASFGFDVFVEEFVPTMCCGATLVITRDNPREQTPNRFTKLLRDSRITAVELPTQFWHAWVEEGSRRGFGPPSELRLVIIGGENVSRERLREWSTYDRNLMHVYGLTETTVTSTVYHYYPRAEAHIFDAVTQQLPIGRPIDNVRILLLNEAMEPVPIGTAGEIYVGGPFLARGYWRRPAETAGRFVPDPFSSPGERLYRTGDLAYRLRSGDIVFAGRTDRQLKIRGQRIESGEIEALLESHPAVRSSLVTLREDSSGRKSLVAYVAADRSSLQGESQLKAWLKARLPGGVIPDEIISLDSFPMTAHGKIDLVRLPTLGKRSSGLGREIVLPRSDMEDDLRDIWVAVLNHSDIGVDDDFFEIGGHSMLALQVLARVQEICGVEVPVRDFIERPTIAGLALAVIERQIIEAGDEALAQALEEALCQTAE